MKSSVMESSDLSKISPQDLHSLQDILESVVVHWEVFVESHLEHFIFFIPLFIGNNELILKFLKGNWERSWSVFIY